MSKRKPRNRLTIIPKYKMLTNEILYQEEIMKNNPDSLFFCAGVIDALESGDKSFKEILDMLHESKKIIEEMQQDAEFFKEDIAYHKGVINGCNKVLDIDSFLLKNAEMSFDVFIYCEDETMCEVLNAAFAGDRAFKDNSNSGLRYGIFSNTEELVSAINESEIGFRSVTVAGVDAKLPSVETMSYISEALNDNRAMFFMFIPNSKVFNANELVCEILKAHKVL